VIVETIAVVQHRLGLDAVRAFVRDVLPLIEVTHVDQATHKAALTALLAANRRHLSLVDCASFHAMREAGLQQAFAFDSHFDEMGFTLDAPGEELPPGMRPPMATGRSSGNHTAGRMPPFTSQRNP
jgi:predicted nucleic acid-binding protein